MKKQIKYKAAFAVLGWLFALLFPAELQAIDITDPSVSGWTALTTYDIAGDTRIGSGITSIDIVGDPTYPSVYYQFSPGGDSMAVRIRVNACDGLNPSVPEFHGFAYIGIDANLNGTIDFFLGAYNPTGYSLGRLGVYLADSAAVNTDPGKTGIIDPSMAGISEAIATFQPVDGDNYSMIEAPGSSFSSNPDYFISFKFNISDVTSAIDGKTYENVTFTTATPFTFIAGTATQDNAMNGDINGIDDINGPTSPWAHLFPHPFSADGSTWRVVTFNTNGGDVEARPISITVKDGNPITRFPERNPIRRNGWRFVGWSNISNEPAMPPAPPILTNPFALGTIINADKTVYATWEYTGLVEDLEEHTVHFDATGGNGSAVLNGRWTTPTTVYYQDVLTDDGSVKTMPANPTPPTNNPGGGQSWVFGGWVTTSRVYNGSGQTANLKNVIVISGQVLFSETISYFLSSQWATEVDSLVYQSHSGEYEYTVYALWLSVSNSASTILTFYDNIYPTPQAPSAPGTLVYTTYCGNNNSPPFQPDPISRQGYVFRGWDTNQNGTGTRFLDPLNQATMDVWLLASNKFNGTTALYAIWQAATYALQFLPNTIDYILDPLIGSPSGTFGYEACPAGSGGITYPVNFPPVPRLFTYDFVEWNTLPDGSGFAVDSLGHGLTINAGDPIKFALITAAADSVTLINGTKVLLGGYTTLYAIWNRDPNALITSTVTFDAMGGTHTMGAPYYAPGDIAMEHHLLQVTATDGYLQYIPTPVWPELEDGKPIYVFAGWSFSNDSNRTVPDPNIVSWISDNRLLTDTILYAVWIPVSTVIFHPRGGLWPDGSSGSIKIQTDDQGYALYVPGYFDVPDNHPLLAGYTFIEWNTEIDGSGDVYHRNTHAANGVLNIYAQWNGPPPSYTDIFYDNNDGSGVRTSDRVLSGSLVTPPPDPVRSGYWRFAGWYIDDACTIKWNFALDVATGDYIVLYAKWLGDRHYIVINRHLKQSLD